MMERVHVALPGREYDVMIGPGLLEQAGAHIAPLLRRPRVVVISDETVADLHLETLRSETKAWERERNEKQTGVDWQFTTDNARIKLKRLYPQIKE